MGPVPDDGPIGVSGSRVDDSVPGVPAPPLQHITPLFACPTINEYLLCPLRSFDVLGDIPGPPRASAARLGLKLLVRIIGAPHGPLVLKRAWRVWHLAPLVVFRRQVKGDRGHNNASARLHALQGRTRRASNDFAETLLWDEMVQASSTQTARYESHATRRSVVTASSERARRLRQAINPAQKAQYCRAASILAQSLIFPATCPVVLAKVEALHRAPPAPVQDIRPLELPPARPISETQFRAAVLAMDVSSAAGPDRMAVRLLVFLATTSSWRL